MNKIKPKACFLITIEIKELQWDYKIGEIIVVPVFSNNWHNAETKFRNVHWGSEYPMFDIVSIKREDGLFKPIQ